MSQAGNNWPYVINLSNSIIGISTLAMPFCFKQCGIILGILILLFSTWLTLVSCQILMKAGITTRRSSYGFLAYYTYGVSGKLAVELGMIGLQIGTLIAQIVVIGDFGPTILSKILGIPNSGNLRTGLIMCLCLGVGLPLGLLKDLNAVSRASTICVCFYVVFILYVFGLSTPNLISGAWYPKVLFWKPDGLFETLPIFAFSFGCQTQLFILYDALPEPSLKTVNGITSSAINLCAVAYLLMGFFGYIAFHEQNITGDIIKLFPDTLFADIMKFGFVISTAITIPLIVFPCRISLYNLLFTQHKSKGHEDSMPQQTHIPEIHFKILTLLIVSVPMIVGILVPNVEFILGINGATMGTLMCFVFPAMLFLKVTKGESRGVAQIVLVCGITILLVSSFAILTSKKKEHGHLEVKETVKEIVDKLDLPDNKVDERKQVVVDDDLDKRKEPVNPLAPDDEKPKMIEKNIETNKEKVKLVEKRSDVNNEEVGQEKEVAVKDDGLEIKLKEKERKMEEAKIRQEDLLNRLAKQQEESKKILEAQKLLMKELKDHEKEHIDSKVIGNQPEANVQKNFGNPSVGQKNILVGQQNIPVGQQNIPVGQQNIPVGQQNIPVGQQNIPVGQQNIPVGQQNIPVGQQNIPVGQQNIPVGQTQQQKAPFGQIPIQNNVGGQAPQQNNVGDQALLQNNVGDHLQSQNNVGGQVPLQNNVGGQVQLQNNVGGQVPLQNNVGGHLQSQNNIGGQVPLQNNVGGHLQSQNNVGGQAPVQNNVGGQVPVQNNVGGQVPVQNNVGGQVPVQNNVGGQVPVQNNVGGQVPVQNNVGDQVQLQNNDDGQARQQNIVGGQAPLQNNVLQQSIKKPVNQNVQGNNILGDASQGIIQNNLGVAPNRNKRQVASPVVEMKQKINNDSTNNKHDGKDVRTNVSELHAHIHGTSDEMGKKVRNVNKNEFGNIISRTLLSVKVTSKKQSEE